MAAAKTARSKALSDIQRQPLSRLLGEEVIVAGEVIVVGKLTLSQTLALARVGMKIGRSIDPDVARALFDQAEASADGGAKVEISTVLLALMDALQPQLVAEFFGVIIDRDGTWVDENFDLAEWVEVFEVLFRHNDPQRVWSVFTQRAGRWLPPTSKPSRN